jgi:hypothetical protein
LIGLKICQSVKLGGRRRLLHQGRSEKVQRLDLIGSVRNQEDHFDISGRAISEELVDVMESRCVHWESDFLTRVMLSPAQLDGEEED